MASTSSSVRVPQSLGRWWAGKTRAERRVATALAVVVACACAWLALWQPLQRDLAALRAAVPVDRAALAAAQRMSGEIAGLARSPASPPATDPRNDLDRILTERGLRGAVTQLDWQEGRARLSMANVRFDALTAALEALQRDARLRIVEVTLTARVDPGTVRADMVLAR